jgi:hypothetical protein
VTAGVLTSAHYGAASATARVTVTAAPSCTMRTAVAHGVADPVVCRLGYVTRGTTITLQSRVADRWRTLTSTRSTGGTWSVGQVFPTKGTVWVRVSVAASKDFGAAVSEPVKVAVR